MKTFFKALGFYIFGFAIGAFLILFGTFILGILACILAGVVNVFSWAFASKILIPSNFIFSHLGPNLLNYFEYPIVARIAVIINLLFSLVFTCGNFEKEIDKIIKNFVNYKEKLIMKKKHFRLIEVQEIVPGAEPRSEYIIQYRTIFRRWKTHVGFHNENDARRRYEELQKISIRPVRNVYILE